ncbi:hypothetical protein LN042_12635 [Kitasatospora sp. RB6PN24]|uniref:hypothetical protein n=1 Tax=Kitasatospora humi TaxID=2893891 RepID=UPI001E39BC35|nr:hypothetical protein [Kitasatospora humi]MCC9307928.1 hypothetical protein [Kitasatospora humi]
MSALGRRLGVAVVLAALLVLLGVRIDDCCDTWVPAASADALMLTRQAPATVAHCDPVAAASIDCCSSAGDHRADLAAGRTSAAAPALTHATGAQVPAGARGSLSPPAQPLSPDGTGGRATLIGICVSRT